MKTAEQKDCIKTWARKNKKVEILNFFNSSKKILPRLETNNWKERLPYYKKLLEILKEADI